MVLTRLSHVGEVCPLGDHSYSDQQCTIGAGQVSVIKKISVASKNGQAMSIDDPCSSVETLEIHILDLPNEILEKVFSYLTYKKMGHIRRTCKRFEQITTQILNSTFSRLQSQLLLRFQTIKAQMPRRESARRKHSLARECDIFETMHMRLTLLHMTFGKHIERKHCCFFAGDILDEVYRILLHLKTSPNSKTFKITDELFDLSTMAMEYFKEHIEPGLPEINYFGSDFLDMTTRCSDSSGSSVGGGHEDELEDDLMERDCIPQSNIVLRKRIRRIRLGMKRYNSQMACMKRAMKACKTKITCQNKQMLEYATRLEEYDKKFEESSKKFSTVLQELNKCKTELQYWRSMSPMHPLVCRGCGRPITQPTDTPRNTGRRDVCPGAGTSGVSSLVYARLHHGSSKESLASLSSLPPLHIPPYLEPPSPSNPSVKNLGSLFDMEEGCPAAKALDLSAAKPAKPSVGLGDLPNSGGPCSPTPLVGYSSGTDSEGEGGKRGYSDEDSDHNHDVDTVGRRVKQRKRIKLDI